MKSTPQTEVERACEILGSQAALAELLGVSPAVVNQWIKGLRPVAPKHCPKIESATGIRCEGLCPEVDWESIRATDAQSPAPETQTEIGVRAHPIPGPEVEPDRPRRNPPSPEKMLTVHAE